MRVRISPTFEGWRNAARTLLAAKIDPSRLLWDDGSQSLTAIVDAEEMPSPDAESRIALSKRFVQLAQNVAAHREPARWDVLYRIAFRLLNESRELLSDEGDDDVARFMSMAKQIELDIQEMHQQPIANSQQPSFQRTNVPATRAATPAGSWRDLPELKDLAKLIDEVPGRVQTMVELQRSARTATPWIPAERDRDSLAAASQRCEGCDLYRGATQAVFGEGPVTARVMLIGEQPGEEEERAGRPFIGPAGHTLDRALVAAGLDRAQFYVTNAVKHLACTERGTKRIHRAPTLIELTACKPWLAAEIELVNPELIVCLGAVAARAIGGPTFRLLEERGEFLQTRSGRTMIATLHPDAVLRADEEMSAQYYAWLVADLTRVRERLDG